MTDQIDHAEIERMRNFVRAQPFTPMSDEQVTSFRAGLREGAHSNAISGNPFNEQDWALFEMFLAERATPDVQLLALTSDAGHTVKGAG